MNVCALYCVYDESYWLPYSVRSIYDVVSRIFIFHSAQPWYGPARDQGETIACLKSLPDPRGKIEIVNGSWQAETEQRNFSLAYGEANGFTYGLIIDSDEIYDAKQLAAAVRHAQSNPHVDCWHTKWFTYWKTVRYRIDPIEPYDPAFLIKFGTCAFIETRNPKGTSHELMPPEICICHHLSYALPDERLMKKHIAFDNHSQSAYAGWFESVWKGWDENPEMENLHPNNPTQFGRAVTQAKSLIPEILWPLYESGALP